jgi:transaldolase
MSTNSPGNSALSNGRNPQLAALAKLGQSVWYDNLSRDVLRSGELKGLVEAGVLGLTSNPSIFKKAIADSHDYDAAMAPLAKKGLNSEQITEELMCEDVAAAADLLRPIYEASHGEDGCASIEVSPNLAADAAGTVEAARRIWKKLARPNIMVKIPGTKECIPAIRTALEEGININVTLLFSDAAYITVAQTYIDALSARAAKGLPIDKIASVASFFVSRVDAIIEKQIGELQKSGKVTAAQALEVFAKVGVANSRLAYTSFQRLFSGSHWQSLVAKGGRVQRPLWASTGTKNPTLSPVLYVEELAGPHTVNTMPPQTLKALMQSASISNNLTASRAECEAVIEKVKKLGVDWNGALATLERDGVQLFKDAYRDLLAAVEEKKGKVA